MTTEYIFGRHQTDQELIRHLLLHGFRRRVEAQLKGLRAIMYWPAFSSGAEIVGSVTGSMKAKIQ